MIILSLYCCISRLLIIVYNCEHNFGREIFVLSSKQLVLCLSTLLGCGIKQYHYNIITIN